MMNNKICNTKKEVPTGIELNDKDYMTQFLSILKDLEKNMTVALTEASNEKLYEAYKHPDKVDSQRKGLSATCRRLIYM